MRTFTLISWGAFILGILTWVGTGFFWTIIESKEAARTERLHAMEQSAQQQLNMAHTKVLLKDTKDARETLDAISSSDILAAVETIEGTGKSLGLTVRISSAIPGNAYTKGNALHSVTFDINSEGGYSSLVRLVQALESLPLLTVIDRVEMHVLTDAPKSDSKVIWHLDARVKLFTTSNVTS